jgi:hypothetical protein
MCKAQSLWRGRNAHERGVSIAVVGDANATKPNQPAQAANGEVMNVNGAYLALSEKPISKC